MSIKVHIETLPVGNVEEPEIYAATPIIEWQDTEKGKWVLENAVEPPTYHISVDSNTWAGYVVYITAELSEEDYTFWLLKWSK